MASTATLDAQALDHIRGRLQQLANSLSSLKRDIEISDPLPAWPTVQSSAQLIYNQLDKLTPLLDDHRSFLASAHAFPLPSFPRPAQEAVLGQLLRKKLEPGVEDWIDEGTSAWTRVEQDSSLASADEDQEGLREFWEWAATQTIDLSTKVRWGLDYTEEELSREGGAASVVTGLRRELNDGVESSSDEDEDEDDDDDDEEEEDTQEKDGDVSVTDADNVGGVNKGKKAAVVPPTAIEDLLKFMNTGTAPSIT